jgi:hypothetical protein
MVNFPKIEEQNEYSIYCDESCHLQNDKIPVMVLGGVCCEQDHIKQAFQDLKLIKIKHGFHPKQELKWVKVSMNKIELYCDIIDYFFKSPFLRFRAVVIPDKDKLDHKRFNQDHNEFYHFSKRIPPLQKSLILSGGMNFCATVSGV